MVAAELELKSHFGSYSSRLEVTEIADGLLRVETEGNGFAAWGTADALTLRAFARDLLQLTANVLGVEATLRADGHGFDGDAQEGE